MNQIAPIARVNSAVNIILPQSIDEIWRIARMAVVGKMAPKSLIDGKDPDEATSACAVAIMAGAELGLTPLMALRSYAIVNGRPSLWGDGIKAVVRQSGRCEYITSGGDLTKGWCESKRSDTGEIQRREFTWAQATKAKLSGKTGPWQEYPDVMMERRAISRCLNDLYADVLGGIVSAEEAQDTLPPDDARPELAPPSPPSPPPAPPAEPLTIEGKQADLDVDAFLTEIDETLGRATTADDVEQFFDELDVQSTLSTSVSGMASAFEIKSRHLTRVAVANGDLFPGDIPTESQALVDNLRAG